MVFDTSQHTLHQETEQQQQQHRRSTSCSASLNVSVIKPEAKLLAGMIKTNLNQANSRSRNTCGQFLRVCRLFFLFCCMSLLSTIKWTDIFCTNIATVAVDQQQLINNLIISWLLPITPDCRHCFHCAFHTNTILSLCKKKGSPSLVCFHPKKEKLKKFCSRFAYIAVQELHWAAINKNRIP